ncbi:MAG TPA: nitroreductase family protein [Streptosporangiaceae bacterium]
MEFTEVIKRRKMVRAFKPDQLPPGTEGRLLRAANRAPSAGFSQGYSFLVLDAEQAAPLWEMFYDDAPSLGEREAQERAEIDALSPAPLVIVPLACKDVYLDNYAEAPERAWTDRDEARWPVPYWYIDTGFTALLILLSVVDEGLSAVFFGIPPSIMPRFRERYGVPERWTPIGAIAVGYGDPEADPVPPASASERKSLDELVHRGRW